MCYSGKLLSRRWPVALFGKFQELRRFAEFVDAHAEKYFKSQSVFARSSLPAKTARASHPNAIWNKKLHVRLLKRTRVQLQIHHPHCDWDFAGSPNVSLAFLNFVFFTSQQIIVGNPV
jgi:hypothetical protein